MEEIEKIENAITLLNVNGYAVIKIPLEIKDYPNAFFELANLLKCKISDANFIYFEEKPYLFKLKTWFPH